ncbi:ACT-domain-containing protein, predicted allosteric regulator of homoserine dehydrogenase [Halovivax ruber XH-70]|uniref:ACT-domain-containing protein, predicted allosteric regulator of homoserine dehydrogenase n=1 Tax=Halovivax ruber (strain DSM 18193 / JCM 13892 / XH-70) TaxID=797302 RepID=L0IDU4_HALRX|nr:ACT domain-containing protein [Halovivax ruber]AGB17003.1 ACT-domain-containing protein, predicted allosteric regulator of homoserine dehydrogenase [Halovivax ruber XH-70]
MSDENGGSATTVRSTADDEHAAYTIRLELEDEPGRLQHALGPITEHGANLRSIHHERDKRTPRGTIPVEIDLSCPPAQFDGLVERLEAAGVPIIQAGERRYDRTVNVVLIGHLVDSDLSETLARIEAFGRASVVDVSLAAPEGTEGASCARLQLAVEDNSVADALAAVGEVAAEKDLTVVEPLIGGRS